MTLFCHSSTALSLYAGGPVQPKFDLRFCSFAQGVVKLSSSVFNRECLQGAPGFEVELALKWALVILYFQGFSSEGPVASTFLVYQQTMVPSRGRTLVS